ncbi:MAG: SusC/RagA family TonB-linked outer membrane protein [Chitinophagaceae bacterium]
MIKIFSVFIFLLTLVCTCAFGQQRQIGGSVTDAKTSNPLSGATVAIKGTQKSALTDAEGNFVIRGAQAGKLILTVSYVGYDAQTINLAEGSNNVTVRLVTAAANNLNEVVIVGVQAQRRRTTISSISSVMSKDIENLPSPSVDQVLQGRVAGLNVQVSSGEPGVAPSLVVRGNSKVNTDIADPEVSQARALSSPLYVIDGIPTNPEDISSVGGATGTNYLAGISINDILSVDVQKDAVATAAWGSRGANGVIYINTKKGRSKKPEFTVNAYTGVTLRPQLLPTNTGSAERSQKMDIIRQYASPAQLAVLPSLLADSLNPSFNNATDWQGLFYRQGAINNVDANISGAADNVNYRVSMNFYNEKGIIQQFGFKRYSIRGNFGFTISPKLKSQFIIAASKADRLRGQKYNNSDDNTPLSGSSQPSSFYRLTGFDSSNFAGGYTKIRNKNVDDYLSASLTMDYTILPELTYRLQGSASTTSSSRDYFTPSNLDQVSAAAGNTQSSYAESDKSSYTTYFVSNTLNYVKKFPMGEKHYHDIVATVSQQFTRDVSNSNYVRGYNVPSNDIRVVSGIPQSDLSGKSSYGADGLLSLLGQVQYDFDGKYLLYGSYRGDASSRFGANSKWGYFPAVGAGWIVSDENFMKGLKNTLSFFKIRGSMGISGLQSPDLYAPYNSYIIPGTYNGASAIQPSYDNGLTKNNLTWAKTTQKNLGFEAQLFNGRLSIDIDFYEKISKNDFFNFALPFYTGFDQLKFNARDLWVSNRGQDITINANVMPRNSPFQWSSRLVLSHNKNTIAKLPNNNRTFIVEDGYGVGRIYAVGQPIYETFQFKYMGVYNRIGDIPFNPVTGATLTYFKGNHKVVPGDPIWDDKNKDGDVWDNTDNGDQFGDRQAAGNPNPAFTGGWTNDFTYKGFELTITSLFTSKRTIINTFKQQQFNTLGGNINNFARSRLPDLSGVDYWTPAKAAAKGDYNAGFPAINPLSGYYYQFFPFSTMFNEDGSYFKIKNVVLSYQLPAALIKKATLSRVTVYGIMDNVLTLKKSTVPDPEAVNQLGIYTGGLYPQAIKFTLGATLQF